MPTEMMDVDSLAVDRLDLETPALQPTGSVVRSELNECHVLDLLIILSRRKQIILRTTLATAVLAAMVSLLLPNRYIATANILPPQQSPSLAASMIGQLGALGAMAQKDLGLKNPNDLYVGMLRSRLTPGVSPGTRIIDARRYGLSSGSVTTMTMKKSAIMPFDVNHLWPLITHSSPRSSAVLQRSVGSEPAVFGSVIENADRIFPSSNGCSHCFF